MNSAKSLVLLVLAIAVLIDAHSYVSAPKTLTNQGQSQSGCRMPGCPGPCDGSATASTSNTYTTSRGATVDISWARNNHPGGFVRFAWAPATASTNAQYDAAAYRYECFEKGPGCSPASSTDTGDASTCTQDGCKTTLVVPNWVADGTYNLQWAWFGGYADLGDYYSCIRYTVAGGNAYDANDVSQGSPSHVVFAGGDYANPNAQQCEYRNTYRLHQCVNEPCNVHTSPAAVEQTGVPVQPDGTAVILAASIYPANTGYPSSNSPPPPATPVTPPSTPSTPPSTPSSPPTTPSSPPTTPSSPPTTPSSPPTTPGTPATPPISPPVSTVTGSSNVGTQTPCTQNSDCASGVCQVNNYCYNAVTESKSKGLDAGGIAAIVFAALVVVIVLAAVGFFYVNRKEVPYMAPFKGRM